jgi:hypothetical protein
MVISVPRFQCAAFFGVKLLSINRRSEAGEKVSGIFTDSVHICFHRFHTGVATEVTNKNTSKASNQLSIFL